jgi:hypothetical protein
MVEAAVATESSLRPADAANARVDARCSAAAARASAAASASLSSMTVSGGGRSSPPLRAEESFAGFLLETGESLRGVVRATGDEEPLLAFSIAFSAANFGFTAAAVVAVVVTGASFVLGAILLRSLD